MRQTAIWRRAAFALGVLMATGALLAACGGGSSEATDEGYAKAICESNEALDDVLTAAFAAALSDEEPNTDDLVEAFENWLDRIDDANPPDDVKPYHDDLVQGVRNAIDALKSGDADFETAFDEIDAPEDPPQAIQDRIAAAAQEVPECDGIDIF